MYDWKYLKICLPDDIRMMKEAGRWEEALELIEGRLKREIPNALRQRLQIERDIIGILRREYTYSWEEAVKLMSEELTEFDPAELKFYQNEGTADWHLVDGQVFFHRRFFRTLTATKPEIQKKWRKLSQDPVEEQEQQILMKTIAKMRSQGESAYRIQARCTLKVSDEAFRPGQTLKVHLPLPAAARQIQEVRILNISPEPAHIAPVDFPSRTVYFEEAPEQNHPYTVEFEIINRVPYIELKEDDVCDRQPEFDTREQEPHILFTPYIQELAAELTSGETNPLRKARKFYDFVTTKVNYTFMRPYFTLENIPEFAAKNLKGDAAFRRFYSLPCAVLPESLRYGSLDCAPGRSQSACMIGHSFMWRPTAGCLPTVLTAAAHTGGQPREMEPLFRQSGSFPDCYEF